MATLYRDASPETVSTTVTAPKSYTFTSTSLASLVPTADRDDATSLSLLSTSDHVLLCISFSRSEDAIVLKRYIPTASAWAKEIRLSGLERALGYKATEATIKVAVYDSTHWQVFVNSNYLATITHDAGSDSSTVHKASYTTINGQSSLFSDPVTLVVA